MHLMIPRICVDLYSDPLGTERAVWISWWLQILFQIPRLTEIGFSGEKTLWFAHYWATHKSLLMDAIYKHDYINCWGIVSNDSS